MNILDYATVELDDDAKAIKIIDQTLLPGKIEIIELKSAQEIWDAIYLLRVRGAPAIGVTAGFGIYLLACEIWEEMKKNKRYVELCKLQTGTDTFPTAVLDEFYEAFTVQKKYLDSSRPTAVNLSWALNRMDKACVRALREDELPEGKNRIEYVIEVLHRECLDIWQEDIALCKAIGEYGLSLVKPGDGLLTHCNAGQLATSKYGTATAPMYLGSQKGYNFRVFCDETRPLLQGARLTAYELQSAGLDVTLICDNMSALVMKKGWVNAVFVGCDRVAANGDTANKIGTSVVATVAKRYGIPVYICAPTSTIDLNTPDGDHIVIEERPDREVTEMWYEKRMAPEGVKVFNPAFDVTDNELITAIITENGIARPPFTESLPKMCRKA